jgi:hypothetical protein
MNRRSFLSIFALAPVAGVMAARDAMAAAPSDSISHLLGSFEFSHGEAIIGENIGENHRLLERAHRVWRGAETFGVDNIAPAIPARPAEDESDLEFIRDEPGVVS